ncbi:MAG: hypothetical protein AB7I50_26850 [Vicinamibacterales bacterium]
MTTKPTDQLKALRAAKQAAATLVETERTLRAQHTALLAEHRAIEAAPRALEELLADKDRLIDEATAKWDETHARMTVQAINGSREYQGADRWRDEPPALPANRYGHPDTLGFVDLCGLVPDLLKRRLEQVIRTSGVAFGLPAAARQAKLAELDLGIAELEAQHTDLVDSAAEVGVVLPLLEVVQARRESDARQRRREEELAAERARGIYRVEGVAR